MSKLYFTDEMLSYVRRHCSECFIERCSQGVGFVPSKENKWDITHYVLQNETSTVEEVSFICCFAHGGGTILFDGKCYKLMELPLLMTCLVNRHLLSKREEADILMPWIDSTEEEPYFE